MNQKYTGPLTLPVEGNPENIKVLLYHLVTNDKNFANKYSKDKQIETAKKIKK